MASFNAQIPATYCIKNMTYEESIRLIEILNPILYPKYRAYFGLLPLPLAFVAMGCTIAYAAGVSYAIKQRCVSRKCYVLLLNRAVGDIMCCGCFLITSLYLFFVSVENFDVQILRVIATLGGCCYWSVMVSYVSLSVLKLFAVYRPLQYKKVITMKRCLHLIALSWLIYTVMVIYSLAAITFVTVPVLQKWSGCRRETCVHVMTQTRESLFFALYVITLIAFGCTVILVKRRTRQSNFLRQKDDQQRLIKTRFPFWKLTLNVSTFAIFNLVYVIQVVYMMVYNLCFIPIYHPELVKLFGLIWCSLLVRILADAILGFITDRHVRISLGHIDALSRTDTTHARGRDVSDALSATALTNRSLHKHFASTYEPHMQYSLRLHNCHFST